jgi:hypothetical protein
MKIKSIRFIRVVMMLLFVMVTASVGLADTLDMVLVGQFSGDASAVAVAGDHAYLGQVRTLSYSMSAMLPILLGGSYNCFIRSI